MLRLAFDFIITWRETRTRPNAYGHSMKNNRPIFNYIRIMQEHADKVFREIFDQLLK